MRELVTLHGGAVAVESVFGKGSVFTVTLPTGAAHLPPDRIESARPLPSTAAAAAIFVEEAERWLPAELSSHELTHAARRAADGSPLIVVADDNADMREYVRRLLAPHFHVETAPDGLAALELIHAHAPDLVITDVMMPRLDGFGLVARLRSDEQTREMPIILLSARAGEESRVEGLEAGADDYLVKPFSTRELLARVESQLKLGAIRQESREKMREINVQLEERVTDLQQARRAALNLTQDAVRTTDALRKSENRYRSLFTSMDEGYCIIEVIFDKNQKAIDWVYLEVNPAFEKHSGLVGSEGKRSREMVPDLEAHWFEAFGEVALTGDPVRVELGSESMGGRWFDVYALRTGPPEAHRVALVFSNITERRRTEDALHRSYNELEIRVRERTQELSEANQKFRNENEERLRIEEDRVKILRRLTSAQEDERRRIGRDLHDQIGQQITALRMKLIEIQSTAENESLLEKFAHLQEYAKQIDADVGSLSYELRPPGMDELGLRASINDFVKYWSFTHDIGTEFYSPETGRRPLNAETNIHVYRIVQEALNNILKHARAKSVSIILEFRADTLILIIEDDGVGCDPVIKQKGRIGGGGWGLVGMQERCLIIGGTMSIESKRGEGTVIFCRFPVEALDERSSSESASH